MKKTQLSLLVGLLAAGATANTAAGVNEKMDEMFGASSNVTNPGVAQGAHRGVITGGNVRIRTPIKTASGFSFDPPSISAGCGGIDMYGGSLSFPSKEQFVQTGRAIVSNIGGYAFKMALKAICDPCESIMTAVQDTVTALNMDNMSSCQIAQGVVNKDIGAAMSNSYDQVASSWKSAAGETKDWFESFNAGGRRPSADVVNEPEMKEVMEGNWTWEAITRSGAFEWLGSDKRAKEEVLSLLGTVITCSPGQNGCPGEEGDEMTAQFLPATLRLHDFVALTSQQAPDYEMYSCSDDTGCIEAKVVHREMGRTASQRVVDVLLGKDGNPGYLAKKVSPGEEVGQITAEENAIAGGVGSGIVARAVACYHAGERGHGHAETIVEGMAPVIAAEILAANFDQAILPMVRRLKQNTLSSGAQQGAEHLEKAREELRTQLKEIRTASNQPGMVAAAVERCSSSAVARHIARTIN